MYSDLYLSHHGIKGQKWGIRRYQNEDGTWTEEGKKRYGHWKGPDTFKYRRLNKKADKGDYLRAKGDTITSVQNNRRAAGIGVAIGGILVGNALAASGATRVSVTIPNIPVISMTPATIQIGSAVLGTMIQFSGRGKRNAINASYMRDRATKNNPNWAGKPNYIG